MEARQTIGGQGPFVYGGPGWSLPGQGPESVPTALGTNSYTFPQPGYLPNVAAVIGGRPEPDDPICTSPELRLISQQLTGTENYSTWSKDLR